MNVNTPDRFSLVKEWIWMGVTEIDHYHVSDLLRRLFIPNFESAIYRACGASRYEILKRSFDNQPKADDIIDLLATKFANPYSQTSLTYNQD